MSPCQRSLKKLRAEGWVCAIVEKWNQYAKVRIDLFGFGDILAIRGSETLIVQTTSGSNAAARIAKVLDNPIATVWLDGVRRIEVHGWAKQGARGERKVWKCRIEKL